MRLLAKAEARKAEAEARKTEAEAGPRNARLLAEAEEAEALAQISLESIRLKAEENLMALSQRGSSAMVSTKTSKFKSKVRSRFGWDKSANNIKFDAEPELVTQACSEKRLHTRKMPGLSTNLNTNAEPFSVNHKPVAPPPGFYANDIQINKRPPEVGRSVEPYVVGGFSVVVGGECGVEVAPRKDISKSNSHSHEQTFNSRSNDMNWLTYLDRQGRNECITLASQVSYDGSNTAFVFYENQIRRLMNENPYEERRLEVLRASCVGQSREMVNLFCAPLKNMTTTQRIEKTLDRLRQRYGVPGGLISEPKVKAVRYGPEVAFTSASLRMFGEDLNTLKVFAYAHDEVNKLSGQLLLDTASRLPNILKRWCLDYLDKRHLNLSEPGFDSLREFVIHEISMMTAEYAQAFFKQDEKDGFPEASARSKDYRIRQVVFETENESQGAYSGELCSYVPGTAGKAGGAGKGSGSGTDRSKLPPTCFVCADSSKHYLVDCEKFKELSHKAKRQTVIEAKRCINCLSLDHYVRVCPRPARCRKCGPNNKSKHGSALHECCTGANLRAADKSQAAPTPAPRKLSKQDKKFNVNKVNSEEKRAILLRTSAVKVVNPKTGQSTLVYAHHDTGSRATLISDNLIKELGLETVPDPTITLRTLADQKVASGSRTNFKLKSLFNGEQFGIYDALVVPQFNDNKNTLPHAVDTYALEHFDGVEIPVAPERERVDVLIGQSDKALLTVLEEREVRTRKNRILYLLGLDLSLVVVECLLVLMLGLP